MQCPCGGSTKDHDVIEKGEKIASYARCEACGRIEWRKRPEKGAEASTVRVRNN